MRDDVHEHSLLVAMILLYIAGLCLAFAFLSPAMARDNEQYKDVPPEIRAWFKSVKSHAGIPCCDIADGHRTDYETRGNTYRVPINGRWMDVPPEAVIDDSGNPTGDGVVWYSEFNGNIFIRCFVVGPQG